MADKMTAVEWLYEQITKHTWYDEEGDAHVSISMLDITKAKEMEREQKQQAYDEGADDACEMFYQMSKS